MNKIKIAKNVAFICFSSFIFIFSLVLFILSKTDSGVYNWELSNGKEFYERDITFDNNAVIGMLIGIAFIIYSIYCFNQERKNLSNEKGHLIMINVVPLLVSFYSLSVFFKELVKSAVKHYNFSYQAYQLYLYIGIVTLAFLVYGIISLVINKKNIK